jgi:predicted ATPase
VNDTNLERELLRDLLAQLLEHGQYPELMPFRQRHKEHRKILDRLEEQGLLRQVGSQYVLTPEGLVACQNDAARRLIATRNELLPCLQDLRRQDPRGRWPVTFIADHTGAAEEDVLRAITFLIHEPLEPVNWTYSEDEPVELVHVNDSIREAQPLQETPVAAPAEKLSAATEPLRLAAVEVTGYRPFHGFAAAPGDLTIIIGANATGKSSLFDFLRFVSFAAQMPIPPEIDPRCVGRMLFHAGGQERLSFAIEARDGAPSPLRYEAEIQGPVGSAKVVRERLSRAGSNTNVPMLHLDFRGGKGSVRDMVVLGVGLSWTVPQNELALRRVLDPRFETLSRFQGFLASWRFYGGFDVSPSAALRRPAHVEESPILAEDGANLSAVLHAMLLERRDLWEELETSLRAAVPGFQTLSVKPKGGKGMVMGTWREEGVTDDLTLADLSDGSRSPSRRRCRRSSASTSRSSASTRGCCPSSPAP